MIAGATIGRAIQGASRRLDQAGIENASREAHLLLGHVLGKPRETLLSGRDDVLDKSALEALAQLIERRSRREPISHILGRREFWSLAFAVTSDCLDPRPDSETVIEAALAQIPNRNAPIAVLDLGTGSGCLLFALLGELPRASGTAVDISEKALAIARDNARSLGCDGRTTFLLGDWGAALAGRFDVVLCNPPYIASGDIGRLQPEIAQFEPRLALDGGADGLDCYRILAPQLTTLLAPGGFAVLEIGQGQADPVTRLMAASGLRHASVRCDLAGTERCLTVALSVVNHI